MDIKKAKELLEKAIAKLIEDKFYDIHGDSPGLRDKCPLCLLNQALTALELCQTCGDSGEVQTFDQASQTADVEPCRKCQPKSEQSSGELLERIRQHFLSEPESTTMEISKKRIQWLRYGNNRLLSEAAEYIEQPQEDGKLVKEEIVSVLLHERMQKEIALKDRIEQQERTIAQLRDQKRSIIKSLESHIEQLEANNDRLHEEKLFWVDAGYYEIYVQEKFELKVKVERLELQIKQLINTHADARDRDAEQWMLLKAKATELKRVMEVVQIDAADGLASMRNEERPDIQHLLRGLSQIAKQALKVKDDKSKKDKNT